MKNRDEIATKDDILKDVLDNAVSSTESVIIGNIFDKNDCDNITKYNFINKTNITTGRPLACINMKPFVILSEKCKKGCKGSAVYNMYLDSITQSLLLVDEYIRKAYIADSFRNIMLELQRQLYTSITEKADDSVKDIIIREVYDAFKDLPYELAMDYEEMVNFNVANKVLEQLMSVDYVTYDIFRERATLIASPFIIAFEKASLSKIYDIILHNVYNRTCVDTRSSLMYYTTEEYVSDILSNFLHYYDQEIVNLTLVLIKYRVGCTKQNEVLTIPADMSDKHSAQ